VAAEGRGLDDLSARWRQLTDRSHGSKGNQSPREQKGGIRMLRSIEIDIVIVHGNAGLIHALSRQMRSLMLMGRSEDELWRDMDPVLRDLLDMEGDKVATMTIDRPGRRVRVDVE
jgi:hypothetical protein